ncbi:MAG: hypothetical protein H7840_04855 [Alphaproteobacteria bacterium]
MVRLRWSVAVAALAALLMGGGPARAGAIYEFTAPCTSGCGPFSTVGGLFLARVTLTPGLDLTPGRHLTGTDVIGFDLGLPLGPESFLEILGGGGPILASGDFSATLDASTHGFVDNEALLKGPPSLPFTFETGADGRWSLRSWIYSPSGIGAVWRLPEPAGYGLVIVGLAALLLMRRRPIHFQALTEISAPRRASAVRGGTFLPRQSYRSHGGHHAGS